MIYHDIEICVRGIDSNEVVKNILKGSIMVKFGQKLEMWADGKRVHYIEEFHPRPSRPITRMFVDIRDYEEFLDYKKKKEAED